MEIRKAERRKAKLRLGIASVSGGGKTYSSLLLAFGLGGKVGLVDTENGSGDLYAHLGEYSVITLAAPYTVAKYREAMKAFEDAGYNTIILDSLSHAWAGEGGLLDKQGKMADAGGNSYAAWRKVTPDHNALVEAMLQSPAHIIATMRSKQEYVLEENEKGKKVPRKVGMAPVQRDGMEYEFTIMMDIAVDHTAATTKDRTGLFDGQYFKITVDTGKKLAAWLESGKDAPKVEAIKQPAPPPAAPQMFQAPAEASDIPMPDEKVTGELELIKNAQTKEGMRYALKLKGSPARYGTASAPAAQRAEGMVGKAIEITFAKEGKKLALMGFNAVKA